jgi:hypothetical protein
MLSQHLPLKNKNKCSGCRELMRTPNNTSKGLETLVKIFLPSTTKMKLLRRNT